MTEQTFIRRRESSWAEFGAMLFGGRKKIKAGAGAFVRSFRELTQDLNTARAHNFDPAVIERLNALVNEGNQILYGQHELPLKIPARFILRTFPQKVRSQWRGILASFLLFYGIAFFFGLLCVRFPGFAGELLSESTLAQFEEMYNPESKHYLVPRGVETDADMFGFYIYNNISIAFRIFAGGIFAGIGSLLLLCGNAVFLGIITGHVINTGLGGTFFPFVIAHSAFELTAIIFSAQAGLLLGYRFFITRGLSRAASVKKAGADALPIIAGSALMLTAAAVIEAFWSPRNQLPVALRTGVGAGMWVLLLLYFLLTGKDSGGRHQNSGGEVAR